MNVLSLFDGMSCLQIALNRSGIKYERYYASEIDRHAIKVTQHNYPNTIQLGDVTKVSGHDLPKIDFIGAGSPCFTADSLVMTKYGHKSISEIRIGDYVLTHKGRFKKVLRIGQSFKSVWVVRGMGNPGISTTEEHPFYVRERYRVWDNDNRTNVRKFHNPEWIKVKNLTTSYFAGIVTNNTAPEPYADQHFWYMIGRYTGDGWYRKTKRKHRKSSHLYQFIICCGLTEFKTLDEKFKKLGYRYNYSKERTGYKFRVCNQKLVEFVQPIGKGASNKIVHPLLINQPKAHIKAYLDGLWDSDGCYHLAQDEFRLTTTSRQLAIGVQFLITQVYNLKTTIHFSERPKTYVIEDRSVNQKNTYVVSYKANVWKQDSGFFENGYAWLPIREVKNTNILDYVYNIEVEDDNSYTVNNFVVHNCQGFSVAGKGLNFEDPRSKLFFEFVRILKECREKNPDIKFLLENVRMKEEHELVISRMLEVNPILINSALVSAQNRERLYWTNIGMQPAGLFGHPESVIRQPKDKGIFLKDILQDQVDEKYYLSEKALARIERKEYSDPKINPDKTGTLNTKNNSGQMSVDSGTTLIQRPGVSVTKNGIRPHKGDAKKTAYSELGTIATENHKASGVIAAHAPKLLQVGSLYENNSDAGRIYSDEGKARTLKGEAGGLGAKMGLYQVGVVNDRGELREASEKAMNIDANFFKCMDNHGQRTMIKVHSGLPRTGGNKRGGTGPLSREDGKTYCLSAGDPKANNVEIREVRQLNESTESQGRQPFQQNRVYDGDGIAPAVQAQLPGGSYAFQIDSMVRRLTPVECCRLQTVPDSYFDGSGISETQQYKMLGNGWTIDVICHLLSYLHVIVPRSC